MRRESVGQIVFERSELGGPAQLNLEFFGHRAVDNCTYPMGKGETTVHAVRQLFKLHLGEKVTPTGRNLKDIGTEMRRAVDDDGVCTNEAKIIRLTAEGFDLIHDALLQWKVTNDARRG